MWKRATEKWICVFKKKKNQQVADNEDKSSPQTSPRKENTHHWFELRCVSGSVWEMRSGWVCDLPTYQQVARGPSTQHQHLGALGSGSIDRPYFCTHAGNLRDVHELWGGGEGKLQRRWVPCFLSAQQFVLTFWTHQQRCTVNITSSEDDKTDAVLPHNPALQTFVPCPLPKCRNRLHWNFIWSLMSQSYCTNSLRGQLVEGNISPLLSKADMGDRSSPPYPISKIVRMQTLHLCPQSGCTVDDVSQLSPASSAVRWPAGGADGSSFLGYCRSEITDTQQGGAVFAQRIPRSGSHVPPELHWTGLLFREKKGAYIQGMTGQLFFFYNIV